MKQGGPSKGSPCFLPFPQLLLTRTLFWTAFPVGAIPIYLLF
jgi:hypothetical protein